MPTWLKSIHADRSVNSSEPIRFCAKTVFTCLAPPGVASARFSHFVARVGLCRVIELQAYQTSFPLLLFASSQSTQVCFAAKYTSFRFRLQDAHSLSSNVLQRNSLVCTTD